MENKIEELENKILKLENITNTLLEGRVLLYKQLELLKERQEQESVLFYEHLQFMNYSQKIKNVENELREIKSKINKKQHCLYR